MGPAILVDKSTLQLLSVREVFYLRQYYNVVLCSTLYYEILGDITKHKDYEASKKEVLKVSRKIYGHSTCFTTKYQEMLEAELIGYEIPMDRRPLLSGGKEVVDGNGERVVLFDEPHEYEALRKWTSGEFSKEEMSWAEDYRKSIQQIKLDIAKLNSEYMDARDASELKKYIDKLIDDSDNQLEYLQFILKKTGKDQPFRDKICNIWLNRGMPRIKDFAPYSYYFLTVSFAFYCGVAKDIFGTKNTNIIDLEYIYYLPFCSVFTSNDKFLKTISNIFLSDDQDFIWGEELKNDLKAFCDYWNEKGEKARFSYQEEYGGYPPDIPNSITCKIWGKWAGERRKKEKMTSERNQEIMKEIEPLLDQFKKKEKG